MSNFAFLQSEWPQLAEPAGKAEQLALPDPRTACFHARRALELAVKWLYTHDPAFKIPYDDGLNALLHDPSFKSAAGNAVFVKADVVRKLGNNAVHSHKPVSQYDGLTATRELFHVLFWLARTYSKGPKPADALQFDQALLPKQSPVPRQTQKQLQELAAQLAEKDAQVDQLLTGKQAMDAQLAALRARRDQEEERGDPGPARLLRSRNPRPVYRFAAEGSGLDP
jgi:type I restriction enzyme R subunit